MRHRTSQLFIALLLLSGPSVSLFALSEMTVAAEFNQAEIAVSGIEAAESTRELADSMAIAQATNSAAGENGTAEQGTPVWLWGLLPIVFLGGLGWWARTRRRSASEAGGGEASDRVESAPLTSPEPAATTAVSDAPATPETPPVQDTAAEPSSTPQASPSSPPQDGTPADEPPSPVAEPGAPAAAESPVFASAAESEPSSIEEPSSTVSDQSESVKLPVPTEPPGFAGAAGLAGATGLAAGAASMTGSEEQSAIEAKKYDVVGRPTDGDIDLASVDEGLPDLPDGYGESRIVLMPRDPEWAYVYWDVSNEHKEEVRRQGGYRLALRLYDVTDIDLNRQSAHNLQQYDCDELANNWHLPIPVSDRDYVAEIGYLTLDGRWLMLVRSNPIHVPPVYPSDWTEDHFATVSWDQDLRGTTLMTLKPPASGSADPSPLYEDIYKLAQSAESQRLAGSLFGSMQHIPGSMIPQQAISSYVFPSGAGMWAMPTASGLTMSGVGMSGVGFSASAPPIRPRQFWLVADAELIVYGATEPNASVTINGQPVQLSPEGTFRFQMSFQDGEIDYPILAVAADGEQSRSIHMHFERQTLNRRTNTPEEAVEEWLEE